jgi:hypothetical protein
MVRQWHRGAIVIGVLVAAGLAVAGPIQPATFESRTGVAEATQKSIITHAAEIEQMLSQANSEGKVVKAGCIQEKLKKAKNAETAAETIMKGWSLGTNDPDYAQRQLDRILLLNIYSMIYADEARACTEAKPTVEGNVMSTTNVGSSAPIVPGQDATRAPFFERPPPATPFKSGT